MGKTVGRGVWALRARSAGAHTWEGASLNDEEGDDPLDADVGVENVEGGRSVIPLEAQVGLDGRRALGRRQQRKIARRHAVHRLVARVVVEELVAGELEISRDLIRRAIAQLHRALTDRLQTWRQRQAGKAASAWGSLAMMMTCAESRRGRGAPTAVSHRACGRAMSTHRVVRVQRR